MKLMMLLFVATTAKNVDPHGVEAFAAANRKLGSPEVHKAPVAMPNEEKDSFESTFDGEGFPKPDTITVDPESSWLLWGGLGQHPIESTRPTGPMPGWYTGPRKPREYTP